MSIPRSSLVALIGFLGMGCATSEPEGIQHVASPPTSTAAKPAPVDPALTAGREKAQKSLDHFIERLGKAIPADEATVRVALRTPTGTPERIWIQHVSYSGGKFEGDVSESPAHLPDVRRGAHLKVDRSQIEDWRFKHDGKTEGGFQG